MLNNDLHLPSDFSPHKSASRKKFAELNTYKVSLDADRIGKDQEMHYWNSNDQSPAMRGSKLKLSHQASVRAVKGMSGSVVKSTRNNK